ncbi:MAG: hypothetical protein U1C97_01195, partial [Candidatus Gracilibacteria bacterium]|nr:hypothetical protein [Candidatus Gracilibacteria bacterium]
SSDQQVSPPLLYRVLGDQPERWYQDIPSTLELRYSSLYPGIDLNIFGEGVGLDQLFTIAPEAEVNDIILRFNGAERLQVTEQGDLLLDLGVCQIGFDKPLAYQAFPDGTQLKDVNYQMLGAKGVSFSVEEYDHGFPLSMAMRIHPDLSSCIPPADLNFGWSLLPFPDEKSLYAVGQMMPALIFPLRTSEYQCLLGSDFDPVVEQVDSANQLLYRTVFGGAGKDRVAEVTLHDTNSSGDFSEAMSPDTAVLHNSIDSYLLLSGETDSPNFPIRALMASGEIESIFPQPFELQVDGKGRLLFEGVDLFSVTQSVSLEIPEDHISEVPVDQVPLDQPRRPDEEQLPGEETPVLPGEGALVPPGQESS